MGRIPILLGLTINTGPSRAIKHLNLIMLRALEVKVHSPKNMVKVLKAHTRIPHGRKPEEWLNGAVFAESVFIHVPIPASRQLCYQAGLSTRGINRYSPKVPRIRSA